VAGKFKPATIERGNAPGSSLPPTKPHSPHTQHKKFKNHKKKKKRNSQFIYTVGNKFNTWLTILKMWHQLKTTSNGK
jgi:hypothetical protein